MNVLLSIGIVVAMLACVALIPLGLPGLWLIAAGALVLVGTSSSSSLDAHFVGRAADPRVQARWGADRADRDHRHDSAALGRGASSVPP